MSEDTVVRQELEHLFHDWSVKAAGIGGLIFLLLSPLDYLSIPALFRPFLGYRCAAAAALFAIAFLVRRTRHPLLLRFLVFLAVLLSAATVEVMILHHGGDGSPYFAGMILLAVVALGLLPSGAGFHLVLAATIQAVYFAPILLRGALRDPRVFLTENCFLAFILAATVLIRHFSRASLISQIKLTRELAEKELWLGQLVDERTEQLMTASREWRITVDSTSDMIMLLDEEDRIVKANAATASLAGRTLPKLPGMSVFDLFAETDLPLSRHPIHEMHRTGVRAQTEFRIAARGSWLLMTAEPTQEGRRPLQGTVITVRDITRIKEMEEALTRSRDDWEETFDSIQEGITIHDESATVLRANAAARRLLGTGTGNLVGRKCHELFHGMTRPIGGCPSCSATRSGKPTTVNLHEPRLNRYLEVTALPRPGGGIVHVVHDISERKQIIDEVNRAASRLQGILERAPFGVFIVNESFLVEFANPAILTITGYTREEFVGACLGEFPGCVDLGMRERVHAAFRGVPFRFGSTPFRCSRGERVIHGQFTGIPVEEGGMTKVLVFVEDLTELKAGEEERQRLGTLLLQAQKMEAVGTLASGIAHDFNNILLAVIGLSDAAAEQLPTDHPAHDDLGLVIGAAERGSDLVKQLLAFSRQQELRMQPVDLGELVLTMRKLLARTLPKVVDIAVRISEPLPLIHADAVQIEQVLMNLAINARDAMSQGGVLSFEAASVVVPKDGGANAGVLPGSYVLLKVRDTGSGMAPGVQERIFDPFFTTKEPGRGTGLGLATVYGIVSQHSGFVRVESSPGNGTTFFVYLPSAGYPPEMSKPERLARDGRENVAAELPV